VDDDVINGIPVVVAQRVPASCVAGGVRAACVVLFCLFNGGAGGRHRAFDAGAAVKTQVHPHIGRIDHLALARDSSNGSSWFLAASEATSTIIRFSAGAGGQQRHQQHVLGGSGMTPLSWVHVVPYVCYYYTP